MIHRTGLPNDQTYEKNGDNSMEDLLMNNFHDFLMIELKHFIDSNSIAL